MVLYRTVPYALLMAKQQQQHSRNDIMEFRGIDVSPARSNLFVEMRGRDLLWLLDVPGHGVLVIRTGSNHDDPTGKLVNDTLSYFTNAEIGR